MTDGVERGPTRTSTRVALAAGVGCVLALATGSLASLVLGVPALGTLAVGMRRVDRRGIDAGAFGLFAAALLAAVTGAPTASTLIGAGLAILAWDAGGNALELGRQVGRDAATREAEIAHLSGTVGVAAGAGGLGYGFYTAGSGGRPVAALVLLSFAAVLLASALRLRPLARGDN
ncbi:hypothetical protein SAMN06269185_0743 [Natronoarchaeum philippinense]|uniref:Major facilitator superfamily (MFS) profile domain-containing protein n=1 Tax=Natronoarchaeum philippinense TaxID=558529 RepID=A0A285N683_NATPI|nr:hypothetical protein [Natronoarchaeum philippinense]SNZ04984.1 hypothetical protein SAMN06269185_0743 [Natronoarchaeum philippinense]